MDAVGKFDFRIKHYLIKPLTLKLVGVVSAKMAFQFSGATAKLPDTAAASGTDSTPHDPLTIRVPDAIESGSGSASHSFVLAGGLLHKAVSTVHVLRQAAEQQLSSLTTAAGGSVVGIDSNILCGIVPGTGDASRDLSSDFVGIEPETEPVSGSGEGGAKRGGIGSIFGGVLAGFTSSGASGDKHAASPVATGGGGGGSSKGLMSSKPPAPGAVVSPVAKPSTATRDQVLLAYRSGAARIAKPAPTAASTASGSGGKDKPKPARAGEVV